MNETALKIAETQNQAELSKDSRSGPLEKSVDCSETHVATIGRDHKHSIRPFSMGQTLVGAGK